MGAQIRYYNPKKLLNMVDLDGEKPEIFMTVGNRSSGKTTAFIKLLFDDFLENGYKMMFVYRFNYELDDVADKIFKDVRHLFYPFRELEAEKRGKGIFCDLFLDEKHCGYAIAINNADQIKRNSHLFTDVHAMFFDEFQSENNHYCPNEVEKLISIHNSVARGNGKQARYVPIYMCANAVSLINPYFQTMDISNRLKKETKFLRGHGFVLEQNYNESAAKAQQESRFNIAFSKSKYVAYASQNIYLNDNEAFIEELHGKSVYICTIVYNGNNYAIREFPEKGVIYCDDRPDMHCRIKISTTTDDHQINYVMLKRNSMLISLFREYFEKGIFRFKNLNCKEAIIKTINIG